ncbi:hypothetical protein [Acidiphilium acidophilum]|uniref:Uncharacterized protein n=1 Tax=Acidiphilium acidophilum TaxID=76588 RepID=A0AAW9DT83_ACIAO|nr:hypothetical protein [Acidiphilium acidophilum]MDX5932304.1 hypothetical protein [Acidiphilium acidophilum]GBQ28647.1 hypothetical protein AA700_1675 [Acidiphilium acidophilum DSM 700]
MSEIAAEGLPIEGDLTWLIARSPKDFAEKLSRLLTDEEWNEKMLVLAAKLIEKMFSEKIMIMQLKRALE